MLAGGQGHLCRDQLSGSSVPEDPSSSLWPGAHFCCTSPRDMGSSWGEKVGGGVTPWKIANYLTGHLNQPHKIGRKVLSLKAAGVSFEEDWVNSRQTIEIGYICNLNCGERFIWGPDMSSTKSWTSPLNWEMMGWRDCCGIPVITGSEDFEWGKGIDAITPWVMRFIIPSLSQAHRGPTAHQGLSSMVRTQS